MDHFVKQYKVEYDKEFPNDPRVLSRLRVSCEQAKRILSSANQANIEVQTEKSEYAIITRELFEELNADLFQKLLEPVEKALRDAKMITSDIHDVVLVGGSTRIPKV